MEKGNNFARFYGLLNRMPGMDKEELKKSLVGQFTGGRTDSLRSMAAREYDAMCRDLEQRVRSLEPVNSRYLRQRRSAVLHQMQLLKVDTADWAAVDSFCLDNRIAGKRFRDLTAEELEALIPKLHAIRRKRLMEIINS